MNGNGFFVGVACVWHVCDKVKVVLVYGLLNNHDLFEAQHGCKPLDLPRGGETGWMQSYSAALRFDLSVSLPVDSQVSRLD